LQAAVHARIDPWRALSDAAKLFPPARCSRARRDQSELYRPPPPPPPLMKPSIAGRRLNETRCNEGLASRRIMCVRRTAGVGYRVGQVLPSNRVNKRGTGDVFTGCGEGERQRETHTERERERERQALFYLSYVSPCQHCA